MSQLTEAQAWINDRSPRQPVLCFCIHWKDRIPDEYFREIYRHIEKDFALCTLSTLEPESFSMPGPIFRVDRQEIRELRGVRIFVCTDQYENDFPDEAFVAAFPHSFLGYDTPVAFPGWQRRMYAQDAYFTTTPQTLRDAALIRQELEGSCNPAHVRRKRPFYQFFPVGCPRIATVQAHLHDRDCEQDSILYAPTGYWANASDPRNRMIGEFAPPMIDALLQEFPQYRICFRPCVTSWQHPDVLKLISLFEGHPRFAVSRDFDHLPEFARAATLVTEYSNIGEVFALSALRPEVRCTLEAARKRLTVIPTGCTSASSTMSPRRSDLRSTPRNSGGNGISAPATAIISTIRRKPCPGYAMPSLPRPERKNRANPWPCGVWRKARRHGTKRIFSTGYFAPEPRNISAPLNSGSVTRKNRPP